MIVVLFAACFCEKTKRRLEMIGQKSVIYGFFTFPDKYVTITMHVNISAFADMKEGEICETKV